MPIRATYNKSIPDILKIYDIKRNKNKNISVNLVKNKENLYNITFNNLTLDDLDFFSKSHKQFTSDELDEMIYHKKMRRNIKDRSKNIQKMFLHGGNRAQNLGVGDIVKIDNKILMTKSCNYYKPYHTFTELSTLKEYDYDLGKKEVKILLSQNVKFDIETFDTASLKDKYSVNDAELIEEIENDFLPEVMNNMQQELSLRDISIQITDKIINECVEKLSNNYENIHNINQYNSNHNSCLDSILTQYSDDFEDESDDEIESKQNLINDKKIEKNKKEIMDNYLKSNTENIKNVIENTPKIIKHENNTTVQEELYPVIDKLIKEIQIDSLMHEIKDVSDKTDNTNVNENSINEQDSDNLKNDNKSNDPEQEEKGYCVIS